MKNDKHEEHLTPGERSVGSARGIETILVFTDFSDNGTAAVRRAAQLSVQHGWQLRIVHVVTPAPLSPVPAWRRSDDARSRTSNAQITLAALAAHATAHNSIRVNTQVLAGTLLDEILRESVAGDLLVLGARGSGLVWRALLGTTARRLLTQCDRPILVVRQDPAAAYRRILVRSTSTTTPIRPCKPSSRWPRRPRSMCYMPADLGTRDICGWRASANRASVRTGCHG